MSRTTVNVLAFLGLSLLASVTAARAMDVEDLLRLAEQKVGEKVLLALVDSQGLEETIGPDEVLRLKRAGLSDDFLAELVERTGPNASKSRQDGDAEGAQSPQGVQYGEENGVLVVTGRGAPDPTKGSARAPSVPDCPPAQVVVVQSPPVMPTSRPEPTPVRAENAFPVGAVHGWTGSTVFVPAHFGEPASHFGRTIHTVSPPSVAPYHHGGGVLHTGNATLHHGNGYLQLPRPGTRTIELRTSRGTIRVPN